MERLTSDNTFEMDMTELALNQVFVRDGWAWYRKAPEDECSVCDLIRSVAADGMRIDGIELDPNLTDEDLGDIMLDWLQFGEKEPEGVLAILYRALWAMAELRERLKKYEDTGLEPREIEQLKGEIFGLKVDKGEINEYRALGSIDHLRELAQAEKDGRLVVLEPATKEGEGKPPCFYNDMGQTFCLGFARGECDDEPIDRCKECWYCELTREEAEAALKKREADNEAVR